MAKDHLLETDKHTALVERFGPLSSVMLNDTHLSPLWRISFVANFFTVPIYKVIQDRFAVSRPEFVIMFSLLQRAPLAARDICLVTGLPKNSISRAVSTLIKAGYIDRIENGEDKREKKLSLSDDGMQLIEQIVPVVQARQTAMYDALDDGEKEVFQSLISKIIANMPNWVDK